MTAATRALAAFVEQRLQDALRARPSALLALSGGATPALYLPALAALDLPWPRIHVTLTDERCVPDSDERSNIALLRRHFLQGPASAASTIFPAFTLGLQVGRDAWARALAEGPWPVDVMVLGMGADAHIASLFPGADSLNDDDPCATIEDGRIAGLPRWSLSRRAIADARAVALAFAGEDKRAAWSRAQHAAVAKAPARLLWDRGDVQVVDFT